MPKSKIHELDGLEGIYDLIKSGEDQQELDEGTLEFKSIDQRYTNEAFVGSGGMKIIQSEFDAYCQRSVARAGLKNSDKSAEVFINEARILAKLEHSNIVPLYDLGLDENDLPYFTMRLLGGKNLQEILDLLTTHDQATEEVFTQQNLLEIFLKVCDAISYAHKKGVLHLDLKPDNIQIDQFGEVLVCDWGLARAVNDLEKPSVDESNPQLDLEQSMDGRIKGTPGFMAPEQAEIDFATRSERTDIYSLGALLYAILTLEAPLKGANLDELIKKTLEGDFLSPQERCPNFNISASLNAVVMKAMAVEPKQRYTSAKALADEVRAYNHGFATRAEEAGFLTLASLLVKRYQRLFVLLLVFIILLSLTVSFFLIELKNEKHLVEQALTKSQRSESRAQDAKLQAQVSEQKALGLVVELKNEKEEQIKLRKKVVPQLLHTAKSRQNEGAFKIARFLVNYALSLDPEDTEARYMAALTQFGDFKFKKSLEILASYKGELDASWLVLQAREYVKKAPTIDELYQLIKRVELLDGVRRKNLQTNLVYSISEKFPVKERFDLARKFLYREHDKNSFFRLTKKNGAYHLSLKDSKTFGNIYCLRNLPLVSLDLSNTAVTDLGPIANIALRTLNISNSRVVAIEKLNLSQLETIDLRGTLVSNLSFLKNSSIKQVYMNDFWTDLSPLKSCGALQVLELPRSRYSPRYLKSLGLQEKVILRK